MSQNRTKWDSRIELLENQIRSGEFTAVRNALMAPDISKVPRSHCARLANIARRAQRPSLSLRLLQPLVRPKVRSHVAADREESLEYAYALQKVGAKNEAIRLLESLSQQYYKAHLASAFHHMFEWNYREAIRHLDRHVGSLEITSYEVTVANVNRLACLVALKDPEAETLFQNLKLSIAQNGSPILRGNSLEIMAQYWIGLGDFTEARKLLAEAKDLIVDSGDVYRLLIEKWLAIADALENQNLEPLFHIRQQALVLNHWETLRDLDFVRAKLEPGSHWADWVYYGTPYTGFRERLKEDRLFAESCWVARENDPVQKWDPWFPIGGGGDLMHRFAASLLKDFYRPARIGEIFSNLFPDQYFDIEVSPNRIHQIASRARLWLEEENVPARLEELAGSYSLRWNSGLALLARKSPIRFTKIEFLFERFRESGPIVLSAKEWAVKLGCSGEKCKRLLREASEAGLIAVQRKGQYSTYVLPGRMAA